MSGLGLHPVPLFAIDKYNIDFAFPEIKLAVEYNGGNWHNQPEKLVGDAIKAEYLAAMGWSLLVFPRLKKPRRVDSGNASIELKTLLSTVQREFDRISQLVTVT